MSVPLDQRGARVLVRGTDMLPQRRNQAHRGVALIVALLLLVVVSIVSLSAVRLSSMSLRVATNHEVRIGAFESAQSVVDATISDAANTPISAFTPGTLVACSSGCTPASLNTITLPNSYL